MRRTSKPHSAISPGRVLTQDSLFTSERYPLPLYFSNRQAAVIEYSLIIRDNYTKEPLLAYMKQSDKLDIRARHLSSKALDWNVTRKVGDNLSSEGIDPYDVCMLIAMAQESAKNELLRNVNIFQVCPDPNLAVPQHCVLSANASVQPCLVISGRKKTSLDFYMATITRDYLKCMDDPYLPLNYGIHIQYIPRLVEEPLFLDTLGHALGLHSRLQAALPPPPVEQHSKGKAKVGTSDFGTY
jgi:hypothetical protein